MIGLISQSVSAQIKRLMIKLRMMSMIGCKVAVPKEGIIKETIEIVGRPHRIAAMSSISIKSCNN